MAFGDGFDARMWRLRDRIKKGTASEVDQILHSIMMDFYPAYRERFEPRKSATEA